ncbi:EamA family transporter [Amnibacterium sp. CER49]|uniref:DMT family transporter n=1 Tax=Amnibacterium sp. CER49 TaxID=3039161 RepID=UPI00244B05C2|nr:EamA family transporter [Amnibacterium sp. CER49]MDH2443374.1 EamA family transporter [Amnibacterium sp. CER49]
MPVLLVLLASALFGTTGTTRALGLPDLDPVVTGALRIALGGLLLAVIALARRRPRLALPPGRPVAWRALLLVAAGTAGVVVYQPAFFAGVRANGVAVGTLVALGSSPVFTGLWSWLALRRRPSSRWFLCTAIAVLGVVLLSGLLDGGASPVSPAGAVASLAAGVAYSTYTLGVKGLLDRGWSTTAAVGAVFGTAGVVSALELAVVGDGGITTGPQLLAVLWLGVMTTTAAYLLFTRGLERLPAATVSTLTLAEPVVAAVLGVLVLGERLSAPAIVGGLLLLLALSLLALPRAGAAVPDALPTT